MTKGKQTPKAYTGKIGYGRAALFKAAGGLSLDELYDAARALAAISYQGDSARAFVSSLAAASRSLARTSLGPVLSDVTKLTKDRRYDDAAELIAETLNALWMRSFEYEAAHEAWMRRIKGDAYTVRPDPVQMLGLEVISRLFAAIVGASGIPSEAPDGK